MQLSALTAINERQIRFAGPRYTPGIDPAAPNLAIRDLSLTLAALGFDPAIDAYLKTLWADFQKASEYASPYLIAPLSRGAYTTSRLERACIGLMDQGPDGALLFVNELKRSLKGLRRKTANARQRLYVRRDTLESDEARRQTDADQGHLAAIGGSLGRMEEFCESPAFQAIATNTLFIAGAWGTGKTHALCDLTNERMSRNMPTLFVLAQHLTIGENPILALCTDLQVADSPVVLLQKLDRLGQVAGCRALLIIDGINEGDRPEWKKALRNLAIMVQQLNHVAVVLSCRQPFDTEILTSRSRKYWPQIEHRGFSDIEFDAQLEYFAYYHIPAPHVPLLAQEFARPLFLKLMCETICNLRKNARQKYFRDLASGQKGMTRVLEDFVKRVGKKIEGDFGLAGKTCWRLLKGTKQSEEEEQIGIAPFMARKLREYVTRDECINILCQVTKLERPRAQQLLARLMADGLLVEGAYWHDNGNFTPVVRLPYQRFSDHLIARHLLEAHLDTRTEGTIRRSFYSDRPLGKIFCIVNGGYRFAFPGLASAIVLEFPERVRRLLPEGERELVYYLPQKNRNAAALKDGFLEGLLWRPSDSFTAQTDRIVGMYLRHSHPSTQCQVLDVLVELGSRPGHPYAANRLVRNLATMDLPSRDLLWSEYLRQADVSSAVYRLMAWIERSATTGVEKGVAANCIILSALACTSTKRLLRDRATRAMVHLGDQHPALLFDLTIANLGFGDPYLTERMLAASYGVAMRYWADPTGGEVRTALPRAAKEIFDAVFALSAPYSTPHVMIRDSALGIITLALKLDPHCLPRGAKKYLRAPYFRAASPFDSLDMSPAILTDAKHAIHMDFGNYTIGRLIPDRRNYDDENPEYKAVLEKILARIHALGYTNERFERIDQSIDREVWSSRPRDEGGTERYGKKYSWIAFFEMYGVREDAAALPEWRKEHRPSDVGVDPSFPEDPPGWCPSLPELFASSPTGLREWLSDGPVPDYTPLLQVPTVDGSDGPWVLLDGYIQQSNSVDSRQVFTFLRTAFVKQRKLAAVLRRYSNVKYPGNAQIPDPGSDYYTYAAEIPWSPRYGVDVRTKRGTARRDIRKLFETFADGRWTGMPVEMTAWNFNWESQHSPLNTVSNITVPAPVLCDKLGLVNHANTWDLFDSKGGRATVLRQFRQAKEFHASHLLYIRKDLLQDYLRMSNRVLITLPWGERTFHHDTFNRLRQDVSDVLTAHLHIHRNAYVLTADDGSIVESRKLSSMRRVMYSSE